MEKINSSFVVADSSIRNISCMVWSFTHKQLKKCTISDWILENRKKSSQLIPIPKMQIKVKVGKKNLSKSKTSKAADLLQNLINTYEKYSRWCIQR